MLLRMLYDMFRYGRFSVAYEGFHSRYIARLKQRSRPFKSWGSFSARVYRDYDDYCCHQESKYRHMQARLGGSYEKRKQRFINNFISLPELAPKNTVLCLGARDGAEVDAFRSLGHLAIGIDLAYPDKSPFVVHGDFNFIPFPESVFDVVYTNCFDHIYDPSLILKEVKRTLKSDGVFVIDLPRGDPGAYESFSWKSLDDLESILVSMSWNVLRKTLAKDGGRDQMVIAA